VVQRVDLEIPRLELAQVKVLANQFANIYRTLVEGFCLKNKVAAATADEELQKRLIAMVVELAGDKLGVTSWAYRVCLPS
jgi:hypothetical protein